MPACAAKHVYLFFAIFRLDPHFSATYLTPEGTVSLSLDLLSFNRSGDCDDGTVDDVVKSVLSSVCAIDDSWSLSELRVLGDDFVFDRKTPFADKAAYCFAIDL